MSIYDENTGHIYPFILNEKLMTLTFIIIYFWKMPSMCDKGKVTVWVIIIHRKSLTHFRQFFPHYTLFLYMW